MVENNIQNGIVPEKEKFLSPDTNSKPVIDTEKKYSFKLESAEVGGADYDPFKARVVEHPVTNFGALTHLLKASLGTGILSMPAAFKAAGLFNGILTTIIVAIICTHCTYILVQCAHELYRRTGKPKMSFAEVAEESCRLGPKWSRRFGPLARETVVWGLFVTYFTTCSCYSVIIAKNFNYVIYHYIGEFDQRITIAILIIPLILLSYVPNLKMLTPFSLVANIFMVVGLGITFYYILAALPSVTERNYVASISTLPICISVVMFAIEAIGVVMPIENDMETPQKFIGFFGVLIKGTSVTTTIYIIVGFFGYLRFGENTKDSITYNLPIDDYAAQAVNILVALAVFCTFGLQFYVCLDITWSRIKDRYQNRPLLANYITRTVLVLICILAAIAVPEIIPFVSLIGCFCFSILGLWCPIFIEICTFWDRGFGRFYWRIFKDIIVVIVGGLALVFGSKLAVEDIINKYKA